MFDTSQSKIERVSVHGIGNTGQINDIQLSQNPLDLSDETLKATLAVYFLSSFQSPEYFSFTFSNEDHKLNPVYQFVNTVFNNQDSFHENSIYLAQHLHENSRHPNIKPGDLFVAHIKGVVINNEVTDALGIFKSENKDTYLKLLRHAGNCQVEAEAGTNIRKLDKGCLIFNIDGDAGYRICIVDNTNKIEAQYWKQEFLNVKPWADAFHHTQNFLSFTKQYLVDQMEEEFKVSKADQIDLLNRSVDFFKSRETFDQREFELEVLGDANVIESFRKYEDVYRDQHGSDIIDNFDISAMAVKRQARIFKSVLKLDKNFHIYIHGNRELIEKGFDEAAGKHYYKIYFDKES